MATEALDAYYKEVVATLAYEAQRMDWKSLFVWDGRVMRIHGWYDRLLRAQYGAEMFRRRANYRKWVQS